MEGKNQYTFFQIFETTLGSLIFGRFLKDGGGCKKYT